MTLGDYLRTSASLPWDWGKWDCCRFADRWIIANGHRSPMAAAQVDYDSERSALLTIARGGGLDALWRLGMARVRIEVCADAVVGDVGIISRPTEDGGDVLAAICTGTRWASLGIRGLVVAPADTVLVAWRVAHPSKVDHPYLTD